jgi:hypothetical protein
MSALRNLYVLVVLSGLTAGSAAQDAGQEQPQAPAQEEPAPEPASPPAEDESQPSTASEEEFIPTEEVLADEEITFPVDI